MTTQTLKAALALSSAMILSAAPALAQDAGAQDDTTVQNTQSAPAPQIEDEVIAIGTFIPDPQRATSQVASYLNPEDLVRQGDSNAALALTRVSGLSIVGGKFAYVRGLGDRYSSALLNGSPLPSPQPLRRTVPLDLFPSSVLNNVAVQKTFSPNLPGEFGGGVIDLRTLRSPTDDFLNLKIGTSFNTETTFQDAFRVRGGDRDRLGFDDGTRDLPDLLSGVLERGELLSDQSAGDLQTIGVALSDPDLTVTRVDDAFPDINASVDLGRIIPASFGEFGFVGTVGFENGWTTERSIRQSQANGNLEDNLRTVESSFQATLNALGSLTLTLNNNDSVQGTLFYVHDTVKESQLDTGTTFSEDEGIFVERSGWFERELLFSQLNGEHELGDLTAEWRGSYSVATRDAPYEREVERQNRTVDGVPQLLFPGNNAHRIGFSDVEDEILSGGLDVSYPLDFDNGWVMEVSGGLDYAQTDRTFNDLNLQYREVARISPELAGARVDLLFSPDTIGPFFEIQEIPARTSDNYLGDLDTLGVYAMADIDVSPEVRVDLGLRYEDSDLTVQTLDRFGNLGVASRIAEDYVLPALAFTWNFAQSTQLRLGYSNTIARPQFRELAPSRFLDPGTDRTFQGNPNLVDSEFTNLDARVERYFGRNQYVTIGAFYKDIDNPIEESTFETSANIFETSFINAPRAELFGVEAEFRTKFDFPRSVAFLNDRTGFFQVNYTYTDATVSAGEDDVILQANDAPGSDGTSAILFGIDGQPLQGTPENILNAQLGWEGDRDQFTVLLGWVDERVSRRGLRGVSEVPDVVEEPGVQLDLVYRRDIAVGDQDFTLGLSARNLLDTDFQEYQFSEGAGRTEFNSYERGRDFSVSLSTKF